MIIKTLPKEYIQEYSFSSLLKVPLDVSLEVHVDEALPTKPTPIPVAIYELVAVNYETGIGAYKFMEMRI